MLYPPGFYYVKKPKRFVILSSDKSSERNLSCFFDIKKPRRMEHLQTEEPFSSDPYFSFCFTFKIPYDVTVTIKYRVRNFSSNLVKMYINCMKLKMLFQKEAYSIALKLQFTLFEIEHVYCLV